MSDLRTPWRAVAAMFILNGALFGIWASRIPAVAQRHELSPGDIGLLLLMMAAGAILAFPLSGRYSDQIGPAKVTVRVAFAYVGSLFLIAFAPGPVALAAALFVFGATHGAMDVAMNTWAGEAERHIGKPVMSSFHAMFSFGAGLGAGSGFLAGTWGLDIAPHFLLAGFLVSVLTLPMAFIPWTSAVGGQKKGGQIFAFPKGPLLVVGFFAFCSSLGEGAMADWSAIFLVFTTAASEAQAALGYTVFSIAMVFMRLLGDRITLRLGPVNTARLAGMIAMLGVLCAVIFANFPMAIVGFTLMGIGYAVIMPLAFSRAANDPDTPPGAAIASVSTLGYGGILLGPPVIGFVAEATTIRIAFVILAVLALMIIFLARAVSAPMKAR